MSDSVRHRSAPARTAAFQSAALWLFGSVLIWLLPTSGRVCRSLEGRGPCRTVAGMRGLVLTGAIVLLHLTGCSTPQPTGSRSVVATDERVVAINLLAMPVALNLNGIVGGDGFAVKVYAASREKPKAVPLTSGRLEILMFDGVLASGVDDSIKPRRTWTFSPTELAEHIVQSSIGVGYYFVIQWGDEFPTQNRISIQARFLPASGQSIVSAPSLITVVSR